MAIVTLSEAFLQRLTVTDGRIYRDRILCGLCLKAGKRVRSFLIATTCSSRHVRITLGRWPLMTVDEARNAALPILRSCRAGEAPARRRRQPLPTLRDALPAYAAAKNIKASSLKRYQSILRTHFATWLDLPVTALKTPAFGEHCHEFAQSHGAAVVEVGRGLIGALIKYLNAVHSLTIQNPFARLADAGLMPDRAQPRTRRLQEADMPAWRSAVDKLPERQRDYLLFIAMTGLRRNECYGIQKQHIDLTNRVLLIPETKNGKPHTLPITPMMESILARRCCSLNDHDLLFAGVTVEHVAEMASRAGAPKFMLHDLRKMLATMGERLAIGDAALRRILNHTAKRSDVLHRHYVSLGVYDISEPLTSIQSELTRMMQK